MPVERFEAFPGGPSADVPFSVRGLHQYNFVTPPQLISTVVIVHGKIFLGGVSAWVAQDDAAAHAPAGKVLGGHPVSWDLTERDHGSDPLAGEVSADVVTGGYRISGAKWLISNATRGRVVRVLARSVRVGEERGFVPVSPGGQWSGMDDLARRLRPVFHRDSVLRLGCILREGPQAIYGKFRRDLPVLRLGHAGGADFAQLSIAASRDHPVRPLIIGFAKEFERLTKVCLARRPAGCTPVAGPQTFALRYAVLLAVAACVGTCLSSSRNPWKAWLHIALIRVAARLCGTAAAGLPERESEVPSAELVRRSGHDLPYCLDSAPMCG